MTTTMKKVPAHACRLSDQEGIRFELLAGENEVQRQWSMLAHTGKVVSRWWGRLVLDMDGAKYRQKLALLKDHDTTQPLGYSTKVDRTKRGIEASGRMLNNELADEVIKYSREGFPFQASLMAVPTKVEEVDAGARATVNGGEVLGPVTIFREWEMHELTLTTLGADDNTSTEAFAANGEIEVETMVKKTNDAPAKELENLATQDPPSHGADTATATENENKPERKQAPDAAKLERERASRILKAADPTQAELAQELVEKGTPLPEALERLAADMRERLQAARQNLRVAAEPIGSGNSAAHEEARRAGGAVNFAALEAADHEPEELKREWAKNEKLRGFFRDEKTFLAWQRNHRRCMHLGSDQKIELLAGGLKSLGYRNVQGTYFWGYQDAQDLSWIPRVAMQLTTDQAMEIYKWLGNVASPNKWTGERQRRSLTDYGITVVGEKYEDTIDCDIDDLRRDKTGQILKRIADLGRKTATLPEILISALIEANGIGYDGLSLFNTAHVVNKSGSQSNDITVSGLGTPDAPTSAGMAGVILAAAQQLLGLKDDQGDPCNATSKRLLWMVPTKYWQASIAALQNEYTSAGVSNTLLKTGLIITPVINPRLNGTSGASGRRGYLFREDAEVLALIQQDEDIPDAFKSEDAYSSNGFWKDKVAWGSKRITTSAPGRFELVVRANLAT